MNKFKGKLCRYYRITFFKKKKFNFYKILLHFSNK